MSKYMGLLILSAAAPFIFSFYPPLKFWSHWKALLHSIVLVLLIFGGWDIFATWRGHWWFVRQGSWGIRIINLPLEEVLFFIIIPFCCIFTWEIINYAKGKLK